MKNSTLLIFICLLILLTSGILGKKISNDLTTERNPFRIGKLNLLWGKATKRLSEEKLVKLQSELRNQDAEELTLKKLKVSGGDKDGMVEASLRKKLLGIATRFSLSDQYHILGSEKIDGSLFHFKDKKLNKLWLKAEKSQLHPLELKILHEEFNHHQEKIDTYHMLLTKGDNNDNEVVNEINGFSNLEDAQDKETYNENINLIRDKHKELKTNYDSLSQKVNEHPNNFFKESQVLNLWQLALQSNFNEDELNSLQEELKHFETKIEKLNYLENNMNKESISKYDNFSEEDKEKIGHSSGVEGNKILTDRLHKQKRYVRKMQDTLENKIIARHSEL